MMRIAAALAFFAGTCAAGLPLAAGETAAPSAPPAATAKPAAGPGVGIFILERDAGDKAGRITELAADGAVVKRWPIPAGSHKMSLTPEGNLAYTSKNLVFVADREGKELRKIELEDTVKEMEALPGGRLLLGMFKGGVVRELDEAGKTARELKGLGQVADVQVLPGGNWLVATRGTGKPNPTPARVVELDKEGKTVWEKPWPDVWGACRLENGNTLLITRKVITEIDKEGKEVWASTGLAFESLRALLPLPGGDILVADQYGRKVFRVSREKKVVWQAEAGEPMDLEAAAAAGAAPAPSARPTAKPSASPRPTATAAPAPGAGELEALGPDLLPGKEGGAAPVKVAVLLGRMGEMEVQVNGAALPRALAGDGAGLRAKLREIKGAMEKPTALLEIDGLAPCGEAGKVWAAAAAAGCARIVLTLPADAPPGAALRLRRGEGPAAPAAGTLAVELARSGEVRCGGQWLASAKGEELAGKLAAAAGGTPPPRLLIAADPLAKFRDLQAVLGAAARAKFAAGELRIAPVEGPPPAPEKEDAGE